MPTRNEQVKQETRVAQVKQNRKALSNAARKVPKFYDLSDVELEHTTTMPLPGDEIFLFSSRIL